MIANQIIQQSIGELKNITKVDLRVVDLDGSVAATTYEGNEISPVSIRSFIDSAAETQGLGDNTLFKIADGEDILYVLIVAGTTDDCFMVGRIAVAQLKNLIIAYKERFDKNNFFQNLILDNLLLVDIYNRAKKLKIAIEQRRCVFVVEVVSENDSFVLETMRGLFTAAQGHYVTSVDEKTIILVKALKEKEEYEDLDSTARMILDMMNSEAMADVHVAYGTIVRELREVSKSYKEAKMALDVGRIFYMDKSVVAYNTLGIGRLIYQLPNSLCDIFIKEIFGDGIPEELDEEMLNTVNKFFENNLNVSETSRQLYVHRNTLVYRIEKLQKATGLDIRVFEDALTLKIALMVASYKDFLAEENM